MSLKNHEEFIRNHKSILKTQQLFKSERFCSNDDKRMQSIDSIETYTYGTSKDLVSDKEEIK